MRYAQINDDGLCVAVSDLRDEHDEPNLILLAGDEDRVGQVWDGSAWSTPTQPAVYKALSKIEFIRLAKSVGGMSGAQHVAASKDANLEEMWLMFNAAEAVEREDPDTLVGLAALEALNYLPNGAESVLDSWPHA